LNVAVQLSHKSVCKCLVNYGANPNIPDANGVTPIFRAVKQNEEDIIKLFVSSGADINCNCNTEARTPLIEAIINGNEKIVELLISNNADLNIADKQGRTPLHWAAHKGNENLVQILLDHKADYTKRDEIYATPLLKAKQGEYVNVVRLLERSFCRINKIDIKDSSGSCHTSEDEKNTRVRKKGKEKEKGKETARRKIRKTSKKNTKLKGKKRSTDNPKALAASQNVASDTPPKEGPSSVGIAYQTPEIDPLSLCRSCFDKPADTVLMDCGHIATCLLCSQYLQRCPICSSPIERVSKVYIS